MGEGIIIETTDLGKKYGEVIAVQNLTLSIQAGEIFGLLGPNGAGKTTTVKMLTTLSKPTQGQAYVCGYDIVKDPFRVREQIGYVSQELTADLYLTGRENLFFQGNLYHLPQRHLQARIEAILKVVGLEERADHLVKTYSGGMKKRLDIAAGLIHTPQVLFLDEPTLGLDPHARANIWHYITQLKQEGITLLLCTNYLDEADQLCDRVAIIDRGQIKVLGSPEELKKALGGEVITLKLQNPATTVQEHFIQTIQKFPLITQVLSSADQLRFFVTSPEEVLPFLIKEATACGLVVQSASYARPTLDDVFFRYTGRSILAEQSSSLSI